MSDAQISALQGVVLAVLTALVAYGTISSDASAAVAALITATLTAVGAFLVKRPKDHQ